MRTVLSGLRRERFKLAAFLEGGTVRLGCGVKFLHPTRFVGRGTCVVEDDVTFGFPQATTSRRPIMIQPRTADAVITIGRGSTVVNGTEIIARASVSVGPRCLIGPRCVLMDSDFHGAGPEERGRPGKTAPVILEENVWLGSEAMILKGVTVGRESVVAARAVVVRSVRPGTIVGSPPAVEIGNVPTRSDPRE